MLRDYALSVAQEFVKDDGLIVFFVLCAVDEGGWAFGEGLTEKRELLVVAFELGAVAGSELGPARGVVAKPFTKVVGGSYFFQPQVDVGLLFSKASGPETIDEDAGAIGFGRFFVDALELDGHWSAFFFVRLHHGVNVLFDKLSGRARENRQQQEQMRGFFAPLRMTNVKQNDKRKAK